MYHVFSFLVSKGFAACLNIGSHVILDFAVFPCKSFEHEFFKESAVYVVHEFCYAP